MLSVPLIALALLAAVAVVWIVTGDRGIGTLLGLVAVIGATPGLVSLRAFGRTRHQVDAGARLDGDSSRS